MLTKIAQSRRDFLVRHRGELIGRALEIGAFDNPTFRGEFGDEVEYLDFFSRAELVQNALEQSATKSAGGGGSQPCGKERQVAEKIAPGFRCIVAHHVIEHVPDPILWFEQVGKLLAEDGVLCLSIPERLYTFDYFRPVSLATQMMRAHAEGLERPDVWQLTEAFYYPMKVDLPALWSGQVPRKFVPRFSPAEARKMAEARTSIYTDAHCWSSRSGALSAVPRRSSFWAVLRFALAHAEEPQPGTNEFRVLLTL